MRGGNSMSNDGVERYLKNPKKSDLDFAGLPDGTVIEDSPMQCLQKDHEECIWITKYNPCGCITRRSQHLYKAGDGGGYKIKTVKSSGKAYKLNTCSEHQKVKTPTPNSGSTI